MANATPTPTTELKMYECQCGTLLTPADAYFHAHDGAVWPLCAKCQVDHAADAAECEEANARNHPYTPAPAEFAGHTPILEVRHAQDITDEWRSYMHPFGVDLGDMPEVDVALWQAAPALLARALKAEAKVKKLRHYADTAPCQCAAEESGNVCRRCFVRAMLATTTTNEEAHRG